MSSAVIAIIILVVIMILFISEVIPLPVTAVLGAVSMAVFGVITYQQAFAGFSNDSVWLVIGMLIVGQAVYESGVVNKVGGLLEKITGLGERSSIVMFSTIAGVLSAFLSNVAVTALSLPVISSIAKATKRKDFQALLFMPIGAAAVLGGNLTLVGSVPQLIAQGMLEEAGAPTMGFFTLLRGALPLFIIGVLYFATVGRAMLKRRAYAIEQEQASESAEHEEEVVEEIVERLEGEDASHSSYKMVVSVLVFVLCVAGFVSGIWTMGTVATVGALVLIITRCISLKDVLTKVDWGSVVIVGGSLGFCVGLDASGAGVMIANGIIGLCGGEAANPLVIFAVLVIIAGILSNFMANTATTAMLVPIGLFLAESMSMNPLAMAIGIVYAANICLVTPVGTVPMTLTLSAGYRFNDYIKIGGPLFILLTIAIIVFVPLLYGL